MKTDLKIAYDSDLGIVVHADYHEGILSKDSHNDFSRVLEFQMLDASTLSYQHMLVEIGKSTLKAHGFREKYQGLEAGQTIQRTWESNEICIDSKVKEMMEQTK